MIKVSVVRIEAIQQTASEDYCRSNNMDSGQRLVSQAVDEDCGRRVEDNELCKKDPYVHWKMLGVDGNGCRDLMNCSLKLSVKTEAASRVPGYADSSVVRRYLCELC